jgi:ATP-dependent protease ClpP protease subunit
MKFFVCLFLSLFVVTLKAEEIVLTPTNSVSFNQAFSAEYTAAKTIEIIKKIQNLKQEEKLYLVLNTPGGSIQAGLDLVEAVSAYKNRISTITIFAASMGHVIVQNLGERLIVRYGTLMQHKASIGGLSGSIPGEVESRLNMLHQMLFRVDTSLATRIGISVEQLRKEVANELWLIGDYAVYRNHADRVVTAKCSKELSEKTFNQKVSIMGGLLTVNVTYSGCPLVTYPLSVKLDNGKEASNFIKEKLFEQNRKIEMTL